ncbi:type III pantothenate kinase, partial [Alphaproteobacteria bacterium]|nr:type III pantothenate kinase [Alphaproteobacteria bacterium]
IISKFFRKNIVFNLKSDEKFSVISSVVPEVNKIIFFLLKKYSFKIKNININNIPKKIEFKYSKNQLGADRIANSFSGVNKYGSNLIIIDFGSATTFDVIKNNIYVGGTIAPGILVSHDSLINKASKLKKISIKKTSSVVGKNTKQSMRAGFYWGYINLINGIIIKIIKEKKYKPKIILTGGLAQIYKKEIKFNSYYEPNLTLEGLYLIGLQNYD